MLAARLICSKVASAFPCFRLPEIVPEKRIAFCKTIEIVFFRVALETWRKSFPPTLTVPSVGSKRRGIN